MNCNCYEHCEDDDNNEPRRADCLLQNEVIVLTETVIVGKNASIIGRGKDKTTYLFKP